MSDPHGHGGDSSGVNISPRTFAVIVVLFIVFVIYFYFNLSQADTFIYILNVVQVFSDVLSYLRLYALSLAGMIMADTFNTMGLQLNFFGGILIIIFGHITNIGLSTMGATIHSLRLNFLEWYHYSWEGGGRLFNPLCLRRSK